MFKKLKKERKNKKLKLEQEKLLYKIKNINIDSLLEKSNYIQSKCINEKIVNKNNNTCFWNHYLPLKSFDNSLLNCNNWDLPENEIIKINEYQKILVNYANLLIDLWYINNNKPINNMINNYLNILPPWIIFPIYNASAIGWRMGTGETYVYFYINFLKSLSEEEFEKYNITYIQPEYMSSNLFSINSINYDIKYKEEGEN